MQHTAVGRRGGCWLPPSAHPRHARRLRLGGAQASLSTLPAALIARRGLAVALEGSLVKLGLSGPLLHLAVSQLMGRPGAGAVLSPLLGQAPGAAAWLTAASLASLAAASGALYYMARATWEGLEPYVLQQAGAQAEAPVLLHGVDVSGSRFFGRTSVQRAANFAAEAHRGQVRKTREPYVTHCIETALVVEGLLSPTEDDERAEAAVVAALLHDVLDDTEVEAGAVAALFGEQVISMVSTVSRLSTTNQIVRRRLRVESAQPTAEEETQLRSMILSMVNEPLVIAIKLADRLHNMRTVYALSPEKQRAVASETRRVWCSLAERLGMFALKSELEDLCFAVLQPREYRALRRELDALWGVSSIPQLEVTAAAECCLSEDCECVIPPAAAEGGAGREEQQRLQASTRPPVAASSSMSSSGDDSSGVDYSWLTPEQLEVKELVESVLPFDATTFNIAKLPSGAGGRRGLEVLQACTRLLMREIGTESLANGLEVSVQGRLKSLYSTFRKMARKGVPLSQVFDARALRVIVDDEGGRRQAEAIAACYKLLPAVHRLFRRVAGEEDDYIAQPKPSGYQSLHTAVIGPGGVPMEVQMRSSSMHSDAEYGKAAHWCYKEKPSTGPGGSQPVAVGTSDASLSGTDAADDLGLAAGQPMLHIGPGGRLRDAVVVHSEFGGRRLLCAVAQSTRVSPAADPAPEDEYRRMLDYVEERGFFNPSQGDTSVALDLFTLCSDGKYHRLDRFGLKLTDVVVPLTLPPPQPTSVASAAAEADLAGGDVGPAPEHAVGDAAGAAAVGTSSTGGGEMEYTSNKIRLLRSMLEWGRELGASLAAEAVGGSAVALSGDDLLQQQQPSPSSPDAGSALSSTEDASAIAAWTEAQLSAALGPNDQSADVVVLVWPGGRLLRLPRGTTAGSVIRDLGIIEITDTSSSSSSGGGGTCSTPSEDDRGAAAAAAAGSPVAPALLGNAVPASAGALRTPGAGAAGQQLLVNVNNRLVPEETPLFDGDYVVLSRDRVRI